jgi:hypothetical protein
MRKSLIGLLASFALGAAAFAGQTAEDQNPNAANPNGPSQFGRADDRASSSLDTHHDLAKNEVTGKIVRADGNTVWIDHMGAVIPLKIEPNTRFESAGIARPKDLKEGQEIRASFTVQNKITNVADSIWLEGATATGTRPTPRAKGVK